MRHLKAISFSVPMFFDADGEVDYRALQGYLERIVANPGIGCLYSMAFNTRYLQLSNEEIIEVNRLVCEIGHQNDIDVIVGHPIGQTEKALIAYCEKIADLRPAAVSVLYPERYFGQAAPVLSYLSAPAQAGLKTFVHEMKMVSGFDGSLMDWPMELIEAALSLPDVVGIKEDSKNDEIAEYLLKKYRQSCNVVIAGGGKIRAIKLASSVGIDSWLNGSLMLNSKPARKIYDAIIQQDESLVGHYIEQIERPYFERIVAPLGWHVAHKLALEVAGYGARFERLPMPVATDSDAVALASEIEAVLQALGVYQ